METVAALVGWPTALVVRRLTSHHKLVSTGLVSTGHRVELKLQLRSGLVLFASRVQQSSCHPSEVSRGDPKPQALSAFTRVRFHFLMTCDPSWRHRQREAPDICFGALMGFLAG